MYQGFLNQVPGAYYEKFLPSVCNHDFNVMGSESQMGNKYEDHNLLHNPLFSILLVPDRFCRLFYSRLDLLFNPSLSSMTSLFYLFLNFGISFPIVSVTHPCNKDLRITFRK